jgi:O-antigen/teichoic acid export membrane protein
VSPNPLLQGIGKHALIYGLGMVLSRAVSFVMLPVYTRYLTPADYGVMALVEMTLDFISIVGGAQLALGVFRFYHKTDDEEAKRQIVSTSFLLVGLLYAIVGTGVFSAAGLLSHLLFGDGAQTSIIRVAALNLAVGALLIVPMALARVKDLSVLFVGANLVKLFIALAFNILFIVVMELGVIGIFLASLISNGLVGGALVVWLVRRVGIRFSRTGTRNLLRYGVPLMGMQIATFMATFSDRYFLQALSDESVVGLYSLAYQFGFLLMVVGFTPIDMVWGPKRFEVARQDDRDSTLASGFVILNVVLLSTALGITVYVGDVLRIMATPAFHSAADVVPLILIAYVFQAWASVQDIGILVRERTEYLTLANLVSAGVALIGYAVLIPRYLQWGAAVATVLAFATRYGLTYWYSQRLWRVRYRWKPVLIAVGWTSSVAGIALMLPELGLVLSLFIRTGLVFIFFGGLWTLPILAPSERASARLLGRQVMKRIPSPKWSG